MILHRTRRQIEPLVIGGLPVTSVERTLLDVAPQVPPAVLTKGVDSALRLGCTTVDAICHLLDEQGGRGVRGVRKLEEALALNDRLGATGSPAERQLLDSMMKAGLPDPTLEWEVATPSGRTYRIDFGWPYLLKGVEVDGLEAHSGADRLDRDLIRQNDIFAAGVELRRFSARAVHRDPDALAVEIGRFLGLL